ncbi:hypothetical protein [Absidia glauca]|uniref:Cullin family profile domain-containing protein n=1 Tax=Absidia glauca TaxID=4829 RepID=A0A163TD66_ABSGL|nr:hypothetical protein [Absidia glauca]
MGKQAKSGAKPRSSNTHPHKSAYKQMKLPISWVTSASVNSSPIASSLQQPNTSQQRLNLTDRTNSDYNRNANADGSLEVIANETSSMSSSAPLPLQQQQPQQQQQQRRTQQHFSHMQQQQLGQVVQLPQQRFPQKQQQAQQHPSQQAQIHQLYVEAQPYYYQQAPPQYYPYSYPLYFPSSRPTPAPSSQPPPQLQRHPQRSQMRHTQNRSQQQEVATPVQQQGETSPVPPQAPPANDQLRRLHSSDDHAPEQSSNKRPRITALTNGQFNQLTLNDTMEITSDTSKQSLNGITDDDPPILNTTPGLIRSLIPTHSVKSSIPVLEIKSQTGFSGKAAPSVKNVIPNYTQVFESFIHSTFEHGGVSTSRQVFYEMCCYICNEGDAHILFDTVSKALRAIVKRICDDLALMASTNVNFLAELISQWERYLSIMENLNEILRKINHRYLIKNTKFSSLAHFGQHVYFEALSQDIKIRKRTISSAAYLISCQRCKKPTYQNTLMASLRLIYEHLPSYWTDFEEALEQSARSFYNDRGRDGVESKTIHSYVTYAINLILAEPTLKDEYQEYIPESSASCSDIAIDELLVKHLPVIFRTGLTPFLDPGRHPILKALYRIVGQYDKASIMQSAFVQYIKDQCSIISKDSTRARSDAHSSNGAPKDETSISVSFVDGLTKLKAMSTHFLKNCFDDDPDFTHAMKESFEVAINRDSAASSRHIANYMDWHLDRLESIPLNDSPNPSQHSDALKRGVDLLRSLQAEDAFKCHYKAGLSRRLLKNKTLHAIDKELYVVHLLQSECGIKFASDLDLMIQDVKVSLGQIAVFKDYLVRKKVKTHIDMQVNILSGETWSISPLNQEVKLSAEMLAHQRRYIEFYHTAQPRRKLTWMPSFSSCLLKASYPNCSIEVDATQYQTMILLLFNDTKLQSLTMDDIARQLQIGKQRRSQEGSPTTLWTRHNASDSTTLKRNCIHQRVHIQQATLELTTMSHKGIIRQKLFGDAEKVQALIMKTLKKHRKLTTEELRDLIAASLKVGNPILSIKGAIFQNQLDLLVKRDLIRQIDEDSFAYHDE